MNSDNSSHVSDDSLARWACNELTAAEQEEALAHLEHCEDCAEVWRAVETVRREAAAFDPGAIAPIDPRFARKTKTSRHRAGRFAAATAAATAAALAASLLVWVNWPRLHDSSLLDSSKITHPVVRSAERLEPKPLSPAEASKVQSPEFSWEAVEGATSFTVELLDHQGDLIWTSERLVELKTGWPTSIEPRAGHYYWRVSANFKDGDEPIASPLISFELLAF